MKPLAIDICCGLGGWSEGLLAEGWDVVGFDIERHQYGGARYPAQLVLQDIVTLSGHQFRGKVALIVASPPCTEYSYMSFPWRRAKQIASALRGQGAFPDAYHGSRTVAELNRLFDACVRIGREAECPTVIENVRGAQPWVGRAKWMFGSFALWGDVPALMPITKRAKVNGFRFDGSGGSFQSASVKVAGLNWPGSDKPGYVARAFNSTAEQRLKATKNDGGSWFNVAHNTTSGTGRNPDGRKGGDGSWLGDNRDHVLRATSSRRNARKAASAHIAKIPFELARWIARAWKP